MNGELLKELTLLSAGVTVSATGAALLVIRVLVSPALAGGSDNRGLPKRRRESNQNS